MNTHMNTNLEIVAVPVPGPVTIDGQLEDWDLSGSILSCPDTAVFLQTAAVRSAAMYDRDGLYLSCRWVDPTPLANQVDPDEPGMHNQGWRSDCLQLRLYTDTQVHVTAWQYQPTGKMMFDINYDQPVGPNRINGLEHGVKMAFLVNADQSGYVQEIFIPWKLLSRAGKVYKADEAFTFGFHFHWGGKDNKSARAIEWQDPMSSPNAERASYYNNLKAWGKLRLSPTGHLIPPPVEPLTIMNLGLRRELFIDPYLIERFEGAALRLHPPQPREIAISCDAPWEGLAPGYPTVLQDETRFRMYYRMMPAGGSKDDDPRQMTGYAESRDGLHWEKPALGLFEVDGSTANNVLWRGELSGNFMPFLDTNPACPPAERYKAVAGNSKKGLWLLVSDDGTHWRERDNVPLALPADAFDSGNQILWDSAAGCYRIYWRHWRWGHPRIPNGRDVRTATSPDLATWSEAQMLEYDPNRSGSAEADYSDDPSGDQHQLYTSGILPYPRAPHLLLGFPQRYCDRGWTVSTDHLPDPGHRRKQADLNVRAGRPTREGTVVTDVMFMASRDGSSFYVWPEAIVRPGIQRPGSWYYGGAWYAFGMLRTASSFPGAPDELSIYIQERFAPDAPGRLRRHTFRMDGFGSLNAPLTGGRAVTKPFTFDGDRLSINFSTSGGGRLRIGLQHADGADIPGFTLDDCDLQYGDELDRIVSWNGQTDVGTLRGRPVRMVIELKDADLFSFVFERSAATNDTR